MVSWTDLTPEEAAVLPEEEFNQVRMPMNMDGEICPWPWEPQQLKDAAMGMYHCSYCGSMELAGHPHSDFVDQAGLDKFWNDYGDD